LRYQQQTNIEGLLYLNSPVIIAAVAFNYLIITSMFHRLLPLLLIALIVCQSVWAMADVHQIHQSGVEHVNLDDLALNDLALNDLALNDPNIAPDSDSVTSTGNVASSPADSPALLPDVEGSPQCSHCCHCHSVNFSGVVTLPLSIASRTAKQQSPIYSEQPLNRQPSSLFRPPRV
jgi:hypothetical protein